MKTTPKFLTASLEARVARSPRDLQRCGPLHIHLHKDHQLHLLREEDIIIYRDSLLRGGFTAVTGEAMFHCEHLLLTNCEQMRQMDLSRGSGLYKSAPGGYHGDDKSH